jgi:hypothetical protein
LDDISVVPVPVPVLRSVMWSNSVTSLSWDTYPGLLYQLQYTTNLVTGTWTNVGGGYAGSGATVNAVDSSAADRQRFYRVAVSTPPFDLTDLDPD